ncbi:hypothetical protein [Lactococcus fujiensis]|uniref:hypothetical protein n=1 Tax=Lactococcus fujiensis TaxID=610251 RepID=UPI0006CFB16B|nr:hypothetical protein [Lactococcus fujiensis]
MKTVENYSNFDIKQLKNGGFRVYADRDLKEYTGNISWRKSHDNEYRTIDEAKESIDRYWESRK